MVLPATLPVGKRASAKLYPMTATRIPARASATLKDTAFTQFTRRDVVKIRHHTGQHEVVRFIARDFGGNHLATGRARIKDLARLHRWSGLWRANSPRIREGWACAFVPLEERRCRWISTDTGYKDAVRSKFLEEVNDVVLDTGQQG